MEARSKWYFGQPLLEERNRMVAPDRRTHHISQTTTGCGHKADPCTSSIRPASLPFFSHTVMNRVPRRVRSPPTSGSVLLLLVVAQLFGLALLLLQPSQLLLSPVAAASLDNTYFYQRTTDASVVPILAWDDSRFSDTGNHGENLVTHWLPPFPITLYGQSSSGGPILLDSDGAISLNNNQGYQYAQHPITSCGYRGPTLLVFNAKMYTNDDGGPGTGMYSPYGVFNATLGTAPNRVLVLDWRFRMYGSPSEVRVQVLFQENAPNNVSVLYLDGFDALGLAYPFEMPVLHWGFCIGLLNFTATSKVVYTEFTDALPLTDTTRIDYIWGIAPPPVTPVAPTPTYVYQRTTDASVVPILAWNDSRFGDTGNHCSSDVSLWQPPFPISLYGQSSSPSDYIMLDCDGAISLHIDQGYQYGQYPITTSGYYGPTLLVFNAHMYTNDDDGPGTGMYSPYGVFNATLGVAPNRVLVLDWRFRMDTSHAEVRVQVLFQENAPNNVSVLYLDGFDALGLAYPFEMPILNRKFCIGMLDFTPTSKEVYTEFTDALPITDTTRIDYIWGIAPPPVTPVAPTPTYVYQRTTDASVVPILAWNDSRFGDTGNHCSSDVSLWQPPFPISLYGQSSSPSDYIMLDCDGAISLHIDQGYQYGQYPITTSGYYGPTLLVFNAHMYTNDDDGPGTGMYSPYGVFNATLGVAPNRVLVLDWRFRMDTSHAEVRVQVLFQENAPNNVSVLYLDGFDALGLAYPFEMPILNRKFCIGMLDFTPTSKEVYTEFTDALPITDTTRIDYIWGIAPPPVTPVAPTNTYIYQRTTDASVVPILAWNDSRFSDTGNHDDDTVTRWLPPFPITLYGMSSGGGYLLLDSNGAISLNIANDVSYQTFPITDSTYIGPSLLFLNADMVTSGQDGAGPGMYSPYGVYSATLGAAPNRTLVLDWRFQFGGGADVRVQVLFYESSPNTVSVLYLDGFSGAYALAYPFNDPASGSPFSIGIMDITPTGVYNRFTVYNDTTPITNGTRVDYKYVCVRDCTASLSSTGSASAPVTVSAPVIHVSTSATSVTPGSLFFLRGLVDYVDSASTNLVWQWNCSSGTGASTINLNDTAVIIGGDAGATLTISQSTHMLLPGTYVFTATLTDVDAAHRTFINGISIPPAGSASVSVTVVPLITVVEVSSTVPLDAPLDPCAISSPCVNTGVCHAAVVGNSSALSDAPAAGNFYVSLRSITYALSCSCPVTQPQFYGATCNFAIVGCPGCTVSFKGGATLRVYGIGLSSAVNMNIGGVSAAMVDITSINRTMGDDTVINALNQLAQLGISVDHLDALTFIAPALINTTLLAQDGQGSQATNSSDSTSDDASGVIDSYKTVSLATALPGAATETTLNYSSLVYYTMSTCLLVNEFRPDGSGGCEGCPSGGFCPGAGRVWPLPGYYGHTEYLAPVECTLPEACIGINSAVASGTPDGTFDYFGADHKCAAGYTGVGCTKCVDQYYQQGPRCLSCASSVDQSAQLTLVIFAALILIGALSLAVAFLPAARLAVVILLLRAVQQLALVGVNSSPSLPRYSESVTAFFVWVNLVNFDMEVLRAGCGSIPTFTYVSRFWYTLLFMLIAGAAFLAACLARAGVMVVERRRNARRVHQLARLHQSAESNGHSNQEDAGAMILKEVVAISLPPDSPLRDLSKRCTHSLLILLSLMYLRINEMLFANFLCSLQPSPVESTASNAVVTYERYLTADGATRCYVGAHLGTTLVSCVLFIFYTLGMPLACFVLLMRAFGYDRMDGISGWLYHRCKILRGTARAGTASHAAASAPAASKQLTISTSNLKEHKTSSAVGAAASGAGVTPSSGGITKLNISSEGAVDAAAEAQVQRDNVDRFGFLFLSIRRDAIAFCAQVLFVQALFAAISALVPTPSSQLLQIFLFGLLAVVDSVTTALVLPFVRAHQNLRKVALGCITTLHSGLLLGLQSHGWESPFFALLVAALTFGPIALVLRHTVIDRKRVTGAKNVEMNATSLTVDSPSASSRQVRDALPTTLPSPSGPGRSPSAAGANGWMIDSVDSSIGMGSPLAGAPVLAFQSVELAVMSPSASPVASMSGLSTSHVAAASPEFEGTPRSPHGAGKRRIPPAFPKIASPRLPREPL